MNVQKILMSTIGGAVVMFFSGWLIWGFGLHQLHRDNMNTFDGLVPDQPNLVLIFLAMVATALLWSIIYNRWANIATFATGAKAGAIIAMLTGIGHDLMMMGSMNLHEGWIVFITNIVGNLIWGAIGGGVIGWILGRGDS